MCPPQVSGKAEHAEDMQEVVKQGDKGRIATDALGKYGNFRGMAKEEFRVTVKFNAQGQEDEKGRNTGDDQTT